MNRREFVKHLALLAAGAAALPAQIAAYERLYDVNSRHLSETGLISIDDVWLACQAEPRDVMLLFTLMYGKTERLPLAMNTRGGIRYVPPPQAPLLANLADVQWTLEASGDNQAYIERGLSGFIRFTDQEGKVWTPPINGRQLRLSDYVETGGFAFAR